MESWLLETPDKLTRLVTFLASPRRDCGNCKHTSSPGVESCLLKMGEDGYTFAWYPTAQLGWCHYDEQGFEMAYPNTYPIYDLLELMMELVLWNQNYRVPMTLGTSRIDILEKFL
ncbi:hypothetical protein STEG23_031123 [Scotinomys teguina]